MSAKDTLLMKYFKTACLCLAFASLGLFLAMIGPTLPTLAYNLQVSIESISYVITVRGFGFLLGSIVSGFIYEKFNVHLLLFGALFLASIGSLVVPFVNYVPLLAAALSTAGFAMGFLNTAGNVLCLQLWGDKSGPYMQTLHFFFSIGTVLAPFSSVAFIMDANVDVVINNEQTLPSAIPLSATTSHSNSISSNYSLGPHPKHTAVRYAFIISSLFTLLVSLGFLFFAFHSRGSQRSSEQQNTIDKEGQVFRVKMLSFLFIFFLVYVGTEVTFGVYVYTFAITSRNHYSKIAASHLTSLFWGAFSVGRLMAIPFSKWFTSAQLLIGDLFGTFVAVVALNCFPFYAQTAEFILWIAVAIYGFSMASIFPSGVSWAEEYITLTGKAAMVLVVGASTGEMLCPMIVGEFIDSNPMNLMYFILTAAILSILNYFALSYLSNSKGKRLEPESMREELQGLIDSSSD